jgi:hypothetical protein
MREFDTHGSPVPIAVILPKKSLEQQQAVFDQVVPINEAQCCHSFYCVATVLTTQRTVNLTSILLRVARE